MSDPANSPHPFPAQPLPAGRRAVIKVGSSLLTDGRGNLGTRNASALASLIAGFRSQGREVLLVSSGAVAAGRSEEHTSELQSLMRISYAVFCLKKKK